MTILHGDCRDHMAAMDANSVDAICTDPPYGLSFMGKGWDKGVPGVEFWEPALRVLKPGGHLLAFGGTRTFHRMAVAIEDAGFEIKDTLSWLYGSGFPKHKSLLKPAWEPIILGRKRGASVLNIDACRIPADAEEKDLKRVRPTNGLTTRHEGWKRPWMDGEESTAQADARRAESASKALSLGRWPANVCLDESAAAALDAMSGERPSGGNRTGQGRHANGTYAGGWTPSPHELDRGSGGASRFFFTAPSDHICLICNGTYTPKHGTMNATKGDVPCEPVNTATSHSTQAEAGSDSVAVPVPGLLPLDFEVNTRPSNGRASTAANSSSSTLPTLTPTAPLNALDSLTASLVPRVRSAESLCERCTTATAQSLAAMLHGQTPASPHGLDSITDSRNSILTRNLAAFAEPLANTGIIPTTASLSILFGSVRHAISESTASSESVPTRFLYQSKASRSERNAGLEGMPERETRIVNNQNCQQCAACGQKYANSISSCRCGGELQRVEVVNTPRANSHPCVKPIALMRWLVKLVCPPGGIVLDPFAGSGSTGIAACLEGMQFIGIEAEAEYVEIARRRIEHWKARGVQLEIPA